MSSNEHQPPASDQDADQELQWFLCGHPQADVIRRLNDELRATLASGAFVFTPGVAGRSADFQARALEAVRRYDAFDEESDPYGEHDFGVVDVDGEQVIFAISYFDPSLRFSSSNPADPTVTRRMLTLIIAQEW